MRLPTVLRTSLATYLLLPLLCLIVSYGTSDLSSDIEQGYWPAASAAAARLSFIIAPVCALSAAWEGARHRRARFASWPTARHPLTVALHTLLPILVAGTLALAVAMAVMARTASGAPGHITVLPVLVGWAVIVGHTAVGYVIGRVLHMAFALPLTLIGSYMWMLYPGALDPLWLGFISGGYINDGLTLDSMPAWQALLAPVLVSAGMLAALALFVCLRRGRRGVLAGLSFALSVALACLTVHNLGDYPTRPRSLSAMKCTGTSPTVCTWPEQRAHAGDIRAEASAAWRRLNDLGLALPATVSASSYDHRRDVLPTPLSTNPDKREIRSAIALSAVPQGVPACAGYQPWAGNDSQVPLNIWAELSVGRPATQVKTENDPQAVALAERVRTYPAAVQATWFRYNVAQLSRCGTQARLDPEAFTGKGSKETTS